MSFFQMGLDENRLKDNNDTVRHLATAIPGSTPARIGKDRDTGTPVYALKCGLLTIELDYLNHEGDGYSLTVNHSEKCVGLKRCKNYPHLLNTVKKLTKFSPEELANYLAPITKTVPADPKAHYTETREWKGWRDFLGVPSNSPICNDCGNHPCNCDKT